MNRTLLHAIGCLGTVLVVGVARAQATGLAGPGPTPAQPCSGAVVTTSLAGFLDDLDTLERGLEHATTADAQGVVARLPSCWRIHEGGAELVTSADWIRRALSAAVSGDAGQWPSRRAALERHLAWVRADAQEWLTAPPGRLGPHARAELVGVLAQPEFQRANRVTWRDLLGKRIRDWIDERLRTLVDRRLPLLTVARALAWVAAIGALAALLVWVWRLRRLRSEPLDFRVEAPRATSREWAARARMALDAGDAREAIRCGYHAALFRFEEQGFWRVDPARTPREYLRLVPETDRRRAIIGGLTRDFERAWYGGDTPDARGLLAQLEGLGCRAPSETAI